MKGRDAPPVGPEDWGLYVHFPYCASKCPYCDFNSHVSAHDDRAYADAVLAELQARKPAKPPPPLRTLFFGGGTPSRWAPAQVARVIDAVTLWFDVHEQFEITLEANPGSTDLARFAAFREAGVNRFSIGCQSFIDTELQWLERTHDAKTATRAVETALATGARVSLDVMYGLPGQSWSAARTTLDHAVTLGTEHVSAYALTLEPGTVLTQRVALRQVTPMQDDQQAELYQRVTDNLQSAGLLRYEVSNYARLGAESLHNLLYWQGGAYLGLGAGAHSYLPTEDGRAVRSEAVRNPAAYLEAAGSGRFPTRALRRLTAGEVLKDRCAVGFRSRWGMERSAFSDHPWARKAEADLVREDLITLDARIRPTPRGFIFNDRIALAFLESVVDD
ncbi:MAG: radical SAM family heme chaperone HemW [Myxococcota bacterium]